MRLSHDCDQHQEPETASFLKRLRVAQPPSDWHPVVPAGYQARTPCGSAVLLPRKVSCLPAHSMISPVFILLYIHLLFVCFPTPKPFNLADIPAHFPKPGVRDIDRNSL